MFDRLVIGEEGWKIGEVKDLVVDPVGRQVKALDVQLFPNIAEEIWDEEDLRGTRVSIGVEHVKNVGDSVLLKICKAQLKIDTSICGTRQSGRGPYSLAAGV